MADVTLQQDSIHENKFRNVASDANGASIELTDQAVKELSDYSDEYRQIQKKATSISARDQELLDLGKRLFAWLQARGNLGSELLRKHVGKLEWQLQSEIPNPGSLADVGASAPWEILADEKDKAGFLARRSYSRFVVHRRWMTGGGEYTPSDFRLSMVFMAASPHGQAELNYRNEEVAIANAAGRFKIDLVVEETGQLDQLADTLQYIRDRQNGPIDALHLSCHGINQPEPHLAFEDEVGESRFVTPDDLCSQTKFAQYQLAFISACHTAESSGTAPSFARQLVLLGLPIAVAWDGPVLDSEATEFSERLYSQLNRGSSISDAFMDARNQLASKESRDWHLCRLLMAENASGPLATGTKSRAVADATQAEQSFLDESGKRRVPIAGFEEFVGRRVELKSCIRAIRDRKTILLHGPGHMGKVKFGWQVGSTNARPLPCGLLWYRMYCD